MKNIFKYLNLFNIFGSITEPRQYITPKISHIYDDYKQVGTDLNNVLNGFSSNSLRVIIIKDSSTNYFAQSIDIDYAASGCTVGEVKDNFIKGLAMTLHAHLKQHGNVNKVVCLPQKTHLQKFLNKKSESQAFNQISIYKFCDEIFLDYMPYQSISFIDTTIYSSAQYLNRTDFY